MKAITTPSKRKTEVAWPEDLPWWRTGSEGRRRWSQAEAWGRYSTAVRLAMRMNESARARLMRPERVDRRGLERTRLKALRRAESAVLAFIWSHATGKPLPRGGRTHAARV